VKDEIIECSAGSEAGLPRRPAADPAAALESTQLQALIARALDKVSPQEKAVFVLRHYDQLMIKDIAASLGLSIGSVKSYLFRAVRKLQKELGPAALASNTETSHD
jgi:RNA polymerase sigma factor (sigma-70 family)